jgi:hypothetical protein
MTRTCTINVYSQPTASTGGNTNKPNAGGIILSDESGKILNDETTQQLSAIDSVPPKP